MRTSTVLYVVLLAQRATFGQQVSSRQVFEAASVKVTDQGLVGRGSTGNVPPIIGSMAQLHYPEASLTGLLCRAYNVVPLHIIAPEWVTTQRYNVMAKIPSGASKESIPVMLQNLLEDRFQMKVHWETREKSGYSLTIGKSGSKLKKSAPDEKRTSGMSGNGHLTWQSASMDELATSLSLFMDRPVVDMTQLPGTFDIALDAAPDSMPGFRFGSAQDSSFPTIFVALRDLGLNLEAGKVSVQYLVVDSALRVPTAN